MAGDFNLFFNLDLHVAGGDPTLKNSLVKLSEPNEAMTYVISGEQEVQKQNELLLLSKIHLLVFNADLITYLF